MKIYDKKLSNIRDLRKERQLLKNRLHPKDQDSSADAKPSLDEGEKQSFFSGLLSGVTSGSLLTSAVNIAPTVIDLIRNRSSRKHAISHAFHAPKTKKSFVSAAVTDFVTGYIKWKILELSYKGIKKLINSDAGKKIKRQAASKIQKTFRK